jgi:Restriction Enzyme Adenine Methylase Associated
MSKRIPLVCQQLENISGRALRKYQDIIRQYIRGQNGLYALYKGERLYYVGLAKNLRGRLKQHLKDRHEGSWDRFSVYLTIGNAHLKEMESLLLRIVKPPGNRQIGRFIRCENLQHRFARDIKSLMREELYEVLGKGTRARKANKTDGERKPVLSIYRSRPRRLKAYFKGKVFRALVRKDGSIRFKQTTFNSPTLAAIAAVGHNINGWQFWRYERGPSNWVPLLDLRKH